MKMSGKASFYILYSKTVDKYYSGITAENIYTRIEKHNTSHYGHKWTSAAQDWELRLEIQCPTYPIARKMELYVKRMKSRKYIERIIQHKDQQELLIRIIENT